ncbi:MAG: hypothetical protein NT105_18755 [Verrucomicrobia bacterium]|nr:hypothetical protein [Verrucomicrobiota bacterium]
MNRFMVMAVAAVLLAAGGCSTTRHGDATVFSQLSCSMLGCAIERSFNLPRIELAEHREYRFHICGLSAKEKVYPESFYMVVPEDESFVNHKVNRPWRSCVLSIELRDTQGKLFFSKQITFEHWGCPPATPRSRGCSFISFDVMTMKTRSSLPDLSSYDAVVRVECPSQRKSDHGYFRYEYGEQVLP